MQTGNLKLGGMPRQGLKQNMADFNSTNRTATFEEWHEQLMDYAELRGGSASDADAWREDYEAGKNPVDAYCDEWGDD